MLPRAHAAASSALACFDDRDPWHPSAAGWDPRCTAAACPRSRCYPGRRRNMSKSCARNGADVHRCPWHPSAGTSTLATSVWQTAPVLRTARRESPAAVPLTIGPWHPLGPGCDHRSTPAASPHSRCYPRRRRNWQSPAAAPLTIGLVGTPGNPRRRAATIAARPLPAPAPDATPGAAEICLSPARGKFPELNFSCLAGTSPRSRCVRRRSDSGL